MSGVNLYDYQLDAVNRMKNGCILCGGVGSGKSRTGLAYYYIQNGGRVNTKRYVKMHDSPQDLYIITTARKRDTLEWEEEMIPFMMTTDESARMYKHKVVVDSWNNVHKYVGAKDAFFIFDEQRVVGDGQWVKSFLKITKENDWILLSATPGDCWTDYIPVFVANGFYKNRTQFKNEHIVYSRFSKFPKIDRYINTTRLVRLRDQILVDMDFKRPTIQHHKTVYVDFDKKQYKDICKTRWNPWKNKPIETASEYCTLLRKVINTDPSRQQEVLDICKARPRVIIFYNFDYELDILMNLPYGNGVEVAQWNGHKHQPIPEGKQWVYLVQYNAGAEGWNCIKTDTIIFYSQNYSYKVMEQAAGRIDRLNTPYTDLWFYHLKSRAGIDLAIGRALNDKKKFNERKFYGV